jgi:thymidylate synthase
MRGYIMLIKKDIFFTIIGTCVLNSFVFVAHAMEGVSQTPNGTQIVGKNVDSLVISGIRHINQHGERFVARAGNGIQAYDVSYALLDSRARLHHLREPKSIRYFTRELIAYFNGDRKVTGGLLQASKFWGDLADKDGNINSNYGYYVFHQKIPQFQNKTQYEWVIQNLVKNWDSRKALININQTEHKEMQTKDFPCTIGMQFFIRQNKLCNVVSSRSTDIFTGLPYDIGFFSVLTELVYKDLKERLPLTMSQKLKLGYTVMKTNFTQIYDQTKKQAQDLVDEVQTDINLDTKNMTGHTNQMPEIESAEKLLDDIQSKTVKTPFMQWIYKHAELKK